MKTAADLARALGDRDAETRRLAVQAIARLRGPSSGVTRVARAAEPAAELLLCALGDDDWRVRKEAAQVAAQVEPREVLVHALVLALEERENIGLRNAAVEALVSIGSDAVAATVEAFGRLDADGRKLAVEVLMGIPDPRAVRALERALADADANVRATAAEALGRIADAAGEDSCHRATAALKRVLAASGDAEETDTLVLLGVLDSLHRLGADVSWQMCARFADDPVLRRYAIAAASTTHEPAAMAALADALFDPAPAVRRDAAIALAGLVGRDAAPAAIAAARRALGSGVGRDDEHGECATWLRERAAADDDVDARCAALVLLGAIRDERDVPVLVGALADAEVAESAENGLKLFGSDAVERLLDVQRTAAPTARGGAISLVPSLAAAGSGAAGPSSAKDAVDAAVIAALRDALGDAAPDVTVAALNVLSSIGAAAELAVVAPFASHADGRVAAGACAALFRIASRHVEAARRLLEELDPRGGGAVVGCVVIDAIARWRDGGDDDLAFLRSALSHGAARARGAAIEALATIGGDAAAEAIKFALADEERDVVIAAVRALGRMGNVAPLAALVGTSGDASLVAAALRALTDADPERLVAAALPLARSPDPAIACAAVEALGRCHGARRDDALFAALEHHEPEVVKYALLALARSRDVRAEVRVGLSLDHDAPEVRRVAAELLGQSGGPGAAPLLRARLERERDPAVRAAIAAAIASHARESDLRKSDATNAD